GELAPFSDLDVVLVHQRRDVAAVADAVWYPVWDEGIRLDHSVRKPAEVLDVARDDLRAQLGLLDGRLVAGDTAVVLPLLADALTLWRQRAGRWLPVLAEQVDERHAEHGDVAFLLEPDLKEAHGGLRDVHVVTAAARAVPQIADQVDLGSLDAPRQVLTAARVELHRLTGRATDRLLLQEQDQVARALGYGDADALMAAIAEAGRTIAWVGDDAWRRRGPWSDGRGRSAVLGWRRRPRPSDTPAAPPQVQEVEPGVAVRTWPGGHAEVVLSHDAPVHVDVTLPMRLAAQAAERRLPLSRGALEALATGAPSLPTGKRWPDELRAAFVRVLVTGTPSIDALEALDHYRLLERVLPEWEQVRNRPQRNAYHRFTVDRHLLEAAANAAELAKSQSDGAVERVDLLVLGTLLHDIGKGYPGDHTEVGMELVGQMGRRMGLPDEDVAVLVAMVRHHLLLPDVATRRDLDDPVTIETVARAAGDARTLALLAALTEADSMATGPAAWGPWKAGLVADLVRRVEAWLAGVDSATRPATVVTERHRQLMQQATRLGRTIVAADTPDVTVVARDRPGLLAAVTGVLALRGLDVRSADVTGEEGYAVEMFVVEPSRGRWPDWQLVGDEIDAVLRGTLPLAERLADQARLYGRRRPAAARPVPTSVTVDNDASATSSVVEVRAADVVGLLHAVTSTLFDAGLDVTAARVSTLGHEVVDAFYVRDRATHTKIDPERAAEVQRAVAAALADQLEAAEQ
ncbi:MAG TPA: [protein-PII] uridylyltransferase, partial [Acidimicrobiales bacterium]|nr:[protein-PII] uridylyltransferase [Acidimicrobiales bacterium]